LEGEGPVLVQISAVIFSQDAGQVFDGNSLIEIKLFVVALEKLPGIAFKPEGVPQRKVSTGYGFQHTGHVWIAGITLCKLIQYLQALCCVLVLIIDVIGLHVDVFRLHFPGVDLAGPHFFREGNVVFGSGDSRSGVSGLFFYILRSERIGLKAGRILGHEFAFDRGSSGRILHQAVCRSPAEVVKTKYGVDILGFFFAGQIHVGINQIVVVLGKLILLCL